MSSTNLLLHSSFGAGCWLMLLRAAAFHVQKVEVLLRGALIRAEYSPLGCTELLYGIAVVHLTPLNDIKL